MTTMAAPRIVAGPIYLPKLDSWEITVSLAVYSKKLASRAYEALPHTIDYEGKTYVKSGMIVADCTAWYRTKPNYEHVGYRPQRKP